eukprot:7716027-Alexandrium_andersonii.AAC.1
MPSSVGLAVGDMTRTMAFKIDVISVMAALTVGGCSRMSSSRQRARTRSHTASNFGAEEAPSRMPASTTSFKTVDCS